MIASAFANRRVFMTGHTGFKGSWLTQWLLQLGAEVTGFSLQPPTCPSLFEQLRLEGQMQSIHGDVRDLDSLRREIQKCQPDVVFHLAAQSLVRRSYREPVETFAVNAMGTVNVLESLRALSEPCAAVIVTTDKCYLNREWTYGYREDDALGGADPYSSSKAMAELAVESYRRSWFSDSQSPVRVASARAGNVIGGGDWAEDRIVPDCIRSLSRQEAVPVRNPLARRPWQHVLDPLFGYLLLAARMMTADNAKDRDRCCSAFNFGSDRQANRTVDNLVDEILRHWPGTKKISTSESAPHEAMLLNLSTDKALAVLQWESRWNFETSVQRTVDWYRRFAAGESVEALTVEQIRHFEMMDNTNERTTDS